MTRPYRSAVRKQQSAETRARIVEAARRCFLTDGYAGTSVTAIARAAGVSSQTVHTHFGAKAGLAAALLTETEEAAGVARWREELARADDARTRLQAWAGWTTAMLSPSRPLTTIIAECAGEPVLAAVKAEGDAARRAGLQSLIDTISTDLAPGLTVNRAVDQAWILTGLETYLAAVACGWDDEQYTTWLGDTLQRLLLV